MQCNIDNRGKRIRIICGALKEGVGLVLLVLAFQDILGSWAYWVGGLAVIIGVVTMLQGLAGFCVFRAIGMKTSV